jgi:hypothetical protein
LPKERIKNLLPHIKDGRIIAIVKIYLRNYYMKSFSQFGIKPTSKERFEGDKIKLSKIINREIIVHRYKIEDSKVYKDRGSCKCLHLQISLKDEMHVVFTSSSGLIDVIVQVPPDGFPFKTTIIQENERFIFT